MRSRVHESGFTLVETALAVGITSIVLISVLNVFIGAQRTLKLTLARAELSLRSRELRDKLLFHIAPAQEGAPLAGLLSCQDFAVNGVGNSKLLAQMKALNSSFSVAQQDLALDVLRIGYPDCRLVRNGSPETRWLQPGSLNLFAGTDSQRLKVFDVNGATLAVSNRFFVNIAGRVEVVGLTVRHDERIVVPVFGGVQATEAGRGGGL